MECERRYFFLNNSSALYELYGVFIAPLAAEGEFKHAMKHRARLVKLARRGEGLREPFFAFLYAKFGKIVFRKLKI